ncbi:hypothetical protein [Christensenella tenuis]|uniref:Uncharacterized protein n=1 Tax=Christensenella tenuis TaxID=2763033 RepID=A0ABR7EGU1_9FIRM|nr:hypothetical protein [Christensenella tenuis]MBC5648349.1 hypothetical protein [Christensenella tenuis]
MKNKVRIILPCVIAVIAVVAILAFMNASAKEPVMEVGGVEIPTLYASAGEKTMTASKSEMGEQESRAERTYADVTQQELDGYTALLKNEGFSDAADGSAALEKTEGDRAVRIEIYPAADGGTTIAYTVTAG